MSRIFRGKGRNEETHERMGLTNGGHIPRSETTLVDGHSHDVTGSKVSRPESEASVFSLKGEMQRLEKNLAEKVKFILILKFYLYLVGFMIITNLNMFHRLDAASWIVLDCDMLCYVFLI